VSTEQATATTRRTSPSGIAASITAMTSWSASGVITKGLAMGGLAILTYRMFLYTALMIGLLALRGRRLTVATLRTALPGGIALGLDITLFFTAVKLTTMANATVIGALQPLVLLFVGPRLFGASERATGRDIGMAFLAVAGVAVVMFGSTGLPDWNPRGDLIAVGAQFAWAWYLIASKRTQQSLDPFEYSAATAVISTIVVLPFAVLSGQDLSWPAASNWPWLIGLAIGPGLVAHTAMNWSLTRIPVWMSSTLSLFIPVTSVLLAWAFIDEDVAPVQFAGMAVVLVALFAVVLRPSRPAVPA